MAAMSSGSKDRKFKVVKGGTPSTRKHHFQSFNQRIAKLSIDPIRRNRSVDLDLIESSESHSYFKATLERWKDLNLSEDFVGFVRDVRPMCDSLPQIVHHEKDVMNILLRHIENRDLLSLEPLLDLLASFAHDLGARFEGQFGLALSLVASLAATHPAVEVIEWSFTCLAWLFKYLSRLLVPDLRPLFKIMAPLLGREPQKTHTTQFAAEALSYLVRKTAVTFHKNKTPLETIVKHVVEDLGSFEARPENMNLYERGLTALFVDSIKGIDRRLHSCGVHIYQTLLEQLLGSSNTQYMRVADLVYGITIGLLHFTDAHGFKIILDIIVDHVTKLDLGSRDANVAVCSRLMFIVSTVRKGSRIREWTSLMNALRSLLGLCDIASDETFTQVYRAAAVILQSSPLDVVLPNIRPVMSILVAKRHTHHFLAFCNDFHHLGPERFKSLIFPHLTK